MPSSDDWGTQRQRLTVSAAQMNQASVLRVILGQMRYFLELYLQNQPDDALILKIISLTAQADSLERLATIAEDIRLLLQSKGIEAGTQNFRGALRNMTRLKTFAPTSEADIETFVDIISGLIMASLDLHWGRQYPDLWSRWFYWIENKNKADLAIGATHFVTNDEVIALDKLLWEKVATEIEDTP
jgi:hypothetical protein